MAVAEIFEMKGKHSPRYWDDVSPSHMPEDGQRVRWLSPNHDCVVGTYQDGWTMKDGERVSYEVHYWHSLTAVDKAELEQMRFNHIAAVAFVVALVVTVVFASVLILAFNWS